MLHSLVTNHALVDGNKRLGWLATAVVLDLNGIDPTTASNNVFDLVVRVAAEPIEVPAIAAELQTIVER